MRDISRRTFMKSATALGVITALAPAAARAAGEPAKIGIVGKVKIP
ncbi:twin-arginine translocation signal domain-containing protein [Mesorhizobium sp. B2-5-4]|nr:twin-arginine translocation signal domain-containing protein [Mesorhizobium sp. B2-5-4]